MTAVEAFLLEALRPDTLQPPPGELGGNRLRSQAASFIVRRLFHSLQCSRPESSSGKVWPITTPARM